MKHLLVTSRYVWRYSVSETQDYNASQVVWCHRMSHYDDAAPANDDYFIIIIIIPIRYLFMLQQSDVLHKRRQSEGHAFSLLQFRVICVRIANVMGEETAKTTRIDLSLRTKNSHMHCRMLICQNDVHHQQQGSRLMHKFLRILHNRRWVNKCDTAESIRLT